MSCEIHHVKNNVYASRRERLRSLLERDCLDALIVLSPANRFYLSGFELHDGQPDESSGMLIITTYGDDWLITDNRYELVAREKWSGQFIEIYSGNMARAAAKILEKHASRTGYESRYVSLDFMDNLKKSLGSSLPTFQPDNGLVEELRMIKEPCEITALEKSFSLNHAVMNWLEHRNRKGELAKLSEKQLAWEIEVYFREHGAEELAFASIVAAGSEAAKPHATPDERIIGDDIGLLVDLGCRVQNYCSDQTRTWWLGNTVPEYFSSTLCLVREAQQAALDIMKPGIPCAEVYHCARKVFVKAGCEYFFTHGLGHGVGLQTHEAPSLSPRSKQKLEEGMVVTVEPGLYYPQWGGIRWEYTVIVEKNGIRLL